MARSITIIGGGIAGLAVGCYARMNGYSVQIFEQNSLPGGLCTAWRRRGYLVDGCIEWLCGSGPGVGLHEIWQELGAMEDLAYYHHRAQIHLELPDLRFTVYTDADELENNLLALAPEDAPLIHELAQGIRDFCRYTDPVRPEASSEEGNAYISRWMSTTLDDLVGRIQNPVFRRAMSYLWGGPVPAYFGLLLMGYAHMHSGGVPLGGSLAFARAIEQRFIALGGSIHYNAEVKKVIVDHDRAVGLELADGTRVWEREGDIVSCADAHLTLFDLLEGRYLDDAMRAWFEQVPVNPSPVLVSLGVNLQLKEAPIAIGGLLFAPAEPVVLYGEEMKLISARIRNYDPQAAPPGKAVVQVGLPGNYPFWKELREDPAAYAAEKERIARQVIAALDRRFIGLANAVEMIDVATPLTFERYTSNWQGSSQGWLLTPQASAFMQAAKQSGSWPASKTLPNLDHFFMAGQWTESFGGVPTAALSARNLIQMLCKRDNLAFIATKP